MVSITFIFRCCPLLGFVHPSVALSHSMGEGICIRNPRSASPPLGAGGEEAQPPLGKPSVANEYKHCAQGLPSITHNSNNGVTLVGVVADSLGSILENVVGANHF